MAKEMESTAQYWEQLLYSTGGALSLEKCFFMALEWRFENDLYTLAPMDSTRVDFSLSSGSNSWKKEKIRQVETNQGSCILGVWLSPDGNNVEGDRRSSISVSID